jgi:predicted transcriptional regulator YheO
MMSSRPLMEAILHNLLPDLQALYKIARNAASKRKIQTYIEHIHIALEATDPA